MKKIFCNFFKYNDGLEAFSKIYVCFQNVTAGNQNQPFLQG